MSHRGRGAARGSRGGSGNGRRGLSGGPQVYRPATGIQPSLDPNVESVESDIVSAARQESADISKLSLSQDVPYRPGYGTRGVPITLWTNYFRISPKPDVCAFRYLVEVDPEVSNRRMKARILDYQANIITTSRLSVAQLEANIVYRAEHEHLPEPDAKVYRVRLQPTGSVAVADLIDHLTSSKASDAFADKAHIIQALNIVLNNYSKLKSTDISLTTSKNVHFTVSGAGADGFDLGAGLQAWRGYVTSIRTAAARLLVNVQVKHLAMYKRGRLDELMNEFKRQHGRTISEMNRFVHGVRIDRLHLKRGKKSRSSRPQSIKGLATPHDGSQLEHPPMVPVMGATAKQIQFYLDETAPAPLQPKCYITVFDYFRTIYNVSAEASLPAVNIGSKEHPNYLPPEVCLVLPAQPAMAQLSPDQTANMIRFAVRRPCDNAKSISETGLANVGLTTPNPVMAAFGLQIDPQMIVVSARILPPPSVTYANSKVAQTRFGAWNMSDMRFSKGAALRRWSVLWLQSKLSSDPWHRKPEALIETLKHFHKTLNDCGLQCSPPLLPGKNVIVDAGQDSLAIENGFKTLLSWKRGEELLLVIIPRHDAGLYNLIKRNGDIHFGIHTVCVIAPKFAKPSNVPYFANVALKINLKLGGTNQTLDTNRLGFLAQGKTMLVGLDVTHPSPGSRQGAPSLAAMVASIAKDLGQFPAVLRAQKGRQEMVADLTDMLKSRLRLWQKHNSDQLPESILVYRDGVSEGQYSLVLEKELPLLQQACRDVYPVKGKQPAISIVVAGKRHSTRFYPVSNDERQIDVRSSNPKHGTVVDRGITEPRSWDFYLQAHTALQGTARPAHYFVIHDEIFTHAKIPPGFSHAGDVLEDLTHNLCYMFGRATKAVSYCPPAYYADIACERGRCYLDHLLSPTASQSESLSSDTQADADRSIDLHHAVKDSMFYI